MTHENRGAAPEVEAKPFDDDFDAPATEDELRAAAALAAALEPGSSPTGLAADDASYAEALRHAFDPAPIAPARLDALVDGAIDAALPRQRGRLIRVAFGGSAAVLAMAAAAVLFLRLGERSESATQATVASSAVLSPVLTSPRSAQDLFDEPFPRTGGTSARVDRIASARERELRANRYAAWGVR
jgi:hypothetical protein